jgi:hypothetical protein
MKVGNVTISKSEQILVLPRVGDDQDIVFRARAVASMKEFEAICPEPVAPGIRTRDGFKPDTKNESYQQLVSLHGDKRLAFIMIKSLEPSEVEWDEVSIEDPSTWLKWQDEFINAGLSAIEVNRIVGCVMDANALNEDKLEEARSDFLLGEVEE